MKRIILITCMIALASIGIYAQEKPQTNDLDKEYTPPNTSIFNSKKYDNTYISNSNGTLSKNIVTFSLLSIPRGYTELSYERAINNRISLSVGYGYYFMRDYLTDAAGDIFDLNPSSDSELSLYQIKSSSDVISKNSYHFSLALKLFLNKNEFDTRYFFEIKSKFMNIHYKMNSSNDAYNAYQFIGNPDTYLNSKIYSANFGWQWNSGNEKIKFSHELTLGLGIRFNKYYSFTLKKLDPGNGNTTSNEEFYFRNDIKTAVTTLSINFGYKIGLGW